MQSHIYNLGLLDGQCSDIRIRAFGRVYHLHRLLLIQSGFFRAMLCGGYAEDLAVSSAAMHAFRGIKIADPLSKRRSPVDADVVELRFDDPNISRAAFDYCIARLYGAGPKLVLPIWSSPYDTDSLAPAALTPSDALNAFVADANAHPATPRLLLSLLATSIYLNIPSITSQVLTLVLCSVTPYTVTHYLRFAIGRGIEGTPDDASLSNSLSWDWELEGPVRTLEQLARPYSQPEIRTAEPLSRASSSTSTSNNKHEHHKESAFDENEAVTSTQPDFVSSDDELSAFSQLRSRQRAAGTAEHPTTLLFNPFDSELAREWGSSPTQSNKLHTSQDDRKTAAFTDSLRQMSLQEGEPRSPEYHYGSAADKIGEACVCWYAQKGYDSFFTMENALEADRIQGIESLIGHARKESDVDQLLVLRERLRKGDIDLLQFESFPRGKLPSPSECPRRPHVKVWAYPSLPSSWARAIISSDSFFVRSEWERYEFAKCIIEFRRKQKKVIKVFDALIDECLHELSQKHTSDRFNKTEELDLGKGKPASTVFGIKAFRRQSTASFGSEDSIPQLSDSINEGSCSSHGVDDADEKEYEELFTSGIYYSHMSFQELNRISRDLSPSTGKPYAPLHVLQAALWVSNELRNHVLSSTRQDSQTGQDRPAWDQEVDDARRDPVSPEAGQDVEVFGELGLSSAVSDFRQVFESHLSSSSSSNRHARSRSGTPMNVPGNLPSLDRQSSLGLGGIAESPLLFGGSGGKEGLLKKRYYLVTSDDTVRFGDGLMSVIGINTSTSQHFSNPRRVHEGMASDDKLVDNLGPTGYAAAQIPHTVPIETLTSQEYGPPNNAKKHRSHNYGIANDVATGRELGESAYRACKSDSSSQACSPSSPSNRSRQDCLKSDDPTESGDAGSSTSASAPSERWSAFEPMRIGVEFFGIDKLSEKQRLYSPTFFYAGSIWNLYIQLVRKTKGVQLGVYLHRQSPNETLPPPSAPTANDSDLVPSSPQVAISASQRRRAEFMSPASPRRAARMDQAASSPDFRAGRDDAAQHLRAGVQQSHSSVQGLDVNGGEGGAARSFFDTSLTGESPLRGAGRQTQAGPSTSSRIGSSISLPGGQTVTSLMGPTTTPVSSDDHDALSASAPYSSSSDDANQFVPAASCSTPQFSGLASNFLPSASSLAGSSSNPPFAAVPQIQPTIPLFPGGPSVLQSCPPPAMPYKDPRAELRAYFSIHCPSPLGNALTKFSSGPDKFTNSQSWGWKSSSLLGVVYLENGDLEKGGKSGFWPRFRCVCTIGLV